MSHQARPSVDGYGPDDWERLRGEDLGDDERSPFARDFDRLLYTPEFRRLQGKAQVATAGEADFFRTRLTHTLEVAQVGRRLSEGVNRRASVAREAAGTAQWIPDVAEVAALPAEQQKIDPDLVEAAAIAHDIGHPPFAHIGELGLDAAINETVKKWGLDAAGGFNANAQSIRLLTRVMSHHGPSRGRQLTRAALDAALKYPWVAGDPLAPRSDVWSVNPTERDELRWIRRDVPPELVYAETIEAQMMDWADDLAYSVHDLDDWNRAGYMPLAQLAVDPREQERAVDFIHRQLKDGTISRDRIGEVLSGETGPFAPFREAYGKGDPIFDVTSGAARRAVRRLRANTFDMATASFTVRRRAQPDASVPRRYQFEFDPGSDSRFTVTVLKELLWLYVVNDARMATQQHGHQHVITTLFRIYADAVRDRRFQLFRPERRRRMEVENQVEQIRSIADYICSMTDAGALAQYERLRSGSVSLHDYA